jgi:hypothetical protein
MEARMDARFARMEASFANFRQEMHKDMSEFKAEVRGDIARLDVKVEKRYADLMKWSLIYWVGAVASIAGLARSIR